MAANLVPVTGYILAVILGGTALYYWRRSTGLYALLVEGANRFEEMRQRGIALEGTLAKSDERYKTHREQTQRLERGIEEAHHKTAELVRRLELKEHETRVVSEKLALQKGHLEKQVIKFQDIARLAEDRERQGTVTLQEQALREQELKLSLSDALRDKGDLEKRFKDADPQEMRKLKRKMAQYDRLYASMKGLKEMADERNRNWEVALRRLSEALLPKVGAHAYTGQEPLGPLVGQALQSIGAQLIDDNELVASGNLHAPTDHDDIQGRDSGAMADEGADTDGIS